MHQLLGDVRCRFSFKPEYASDFLDNGRTVIEYSDMSVEEATTYIEEFMDSIEEVQILIDGHKVVTMSDFMEES